MPEPNEVDPETLLYRRVSPQMLIASPAGCLRAKSAVFKQTPTLSVVIADTLGELGRTPTSILDGFPGQSLIAFPVAAAVAHDLVVARSPMADEPAHADVVGHRTSAIARSLLNASQWVVEPAGPCPTPAG